MAFIWKVLSFAVYATGPKLEKQVNQLVAYMLNLILLESGGSNEDTKLRAGFMLILRMRLHCLVA